MYLLTIPQIINLKKNSNNENIFWLKTFIIHRNMLLCKTSIEILLLFYCFSIIDDFLKQAMQESNVTLISFTKSKLAMNLVVVIFMQEFPIFHYKVRRTMIFFPISPYNLIHLLLLFSSTQHNTRMNFLF